MVFLPPSFFSWVDEKSSISRLKGVAVMHLRVKLLRGPALVASSSQSSLPSAVGLQSNCFFAEDSSCSCPLLTCWYLELRFESTFGSALLSAPSLLKGRLPLGWSFDTSSVESNEINIGDIFEYDFAPWLRKPFPLKCKAMTFATLRSIPYVFIVS